MKIIKLIYDKYENEIDSYLISKGVFVNNIPDGGYRIIK